MSRSRLRQRLPASTWSSPVMTTPMHASWPRTANPSQKNGVTYFICGDLGEKSKNVNYAMTSDFSFAYKEQDYAGLIMYVTANGKEMTITAYDSKDGRVVDSTTLQSRCSKATS